MRGQCVITAFFTVFLADRQQRCALHRCSPALRAILFSTRPRVLGNFDGTPSLSVAVEVGSRDTDDNAHTISGESIKEARTARGSSPSAKHFAG